MKIDDHITGLDIVKSIIGDKWKFMIIFHLFTGPLRYGELLFRIDAITKKVLTENLKELEHIHILKKQKITEDKNTISIYSLTEIGMELKPIFASLAKWGNLYQEDYFCKYEA